MFWPSHQKTRVFSQLNQHQLWKYSRTYATSNYFFVFHLEVYILRSCAYKNWNCHGWKYIINNFIEYINIYVFSTWYILIFFENKHYRQLLFCNLKDVTGYLRGVIIFYDDANQLMFISSKDPCLLSAESVSIVEIVQRICKKQLLIILLVRTETFCGIARLKVVIVMVENTLLATLLHT